MHKRNLFRRSFRMNIITLLCLSVFVCSFTTMICFALLSPAASFEDIAQGLNLRHIRMNNKTKEVHQENILKASKLLHKQLDQKMSSVLMLEQNSIPVIFVITPTFSRPVQKAELTRLAQTFLLVPKLHWILVEDRANKSNLVSDFLQGSGLNYTHLNHETPAEHKMKDSDPNWLKPRGVLQRNEGLSWLRSRSNTITKAGVVYFADDDNTYDIELFNEMRTTKTVSVWPVGLVGKLLYEAPYCENGKVIGWRTYWKPERKFAMDMAGFAINLDLILENSDVFFPLRVRRGELETEFLSEIITIDQLEPKASNCTKILVWHTRTEKVDLRNEEKFKKLGIQQLDYRIEV